MTDLVQLQNDLLYLLQSADALSVVNVVQYRKLRLASEIDYSAIYLTGRSAGGPSGAGILIEMPKFQAVDPNVPGPQGKLVVSFVAIEEPNLNLTPGSGTQLDAETLAQIVLDQVHLAQMEGVGEFYADGDNALQPANEFPQGLVAYRVQLYVRQGEDQTQRVDLPNIVEAGLQVTLTNTANFPNAAIYYTLDGTFPGPANAGAVKYAAPFDATGVAKIRWAAYQQDFNGSFVGQAVNPNP